MSALEAVGAFVADVSETALPAPARAQAVLALRDTLGTMVGGSHTTAGRIAADVAAREGGPSFAAFADAIAASALDYDDGHYRGGAIHPSSVVVPTLLATAPAGTDVDELLLAYIAGLEVGLRAAHLLWPRHAEDQYHCTGTAAALGAAAAGAKVRGLDADGISRAIALAWAHVPMSTFQLPMVKESIGWSAATATAAVGLAEAAFHRMPAGVRRPAPDSLPPTPFDRPGAMQDPFVDTWGTVFEAANTYFKPFAACRYTHAAAGHLRAFLAEHALAAADVASIDVAVPRPAAFLDDRRPPTLEHAQYSFPFVLAAIVVDGAAGSNQIAERRLDDPELLGVCKCVAVAHDAELDPLYPARLVVTGADGSRESILCEVAPGDTEDPLDDATLVAKFVELLTPSVGAVEAASLASALAAPTGLVSDLVGPVLRRG